MYGKMQEFELTESIPLMCTSATGGQYPVFSHPEFLQGALPGWAGASAPDCGMAGHPASILSSPRADCRVAIT